MVGITIIRHRELGVGINNRELMFWQCTGPGRRSDLYVPQPKVREDLFINLSSLEKTKGGRDDYRETLQSDYYRH